ncbi:MAG TPA: pyridoxamine 5'-phosphate oxidase family protein [Silvibacterium sp.]|nr:pyridoxamine 5'-phosphate oxidase family protein [Silvibacterium sp.]
MAISEQEDNSFRELVGPEGLGKIAELVKDIRICMMSTVGPDGEIESRPMATQETAFDGTVWFLTRGSSEKASDIRQDAHVALMYADPENSKYVTLRGRASMHRDEAKIKELWNPMYKAWFPKGEDDPDITVVRVDVTEGDYWEANASKLVRGMKYLAAAATGGGVLMGDAGHVVVKAVA